MAGFGGVIPAVLSTGLTTVDAGGLVGMDVGDWARAADRAATVQPVVKIRIREDFMVANNTWI